MNDKKYTEEMVKNLNTKFKGKQAALKFDREPTEGSNNPVTSDGIKKYVDSHGGGGGTTYKAGENIQIKGNVISATDTKYTAGRNIQINGTQISATVPEYEAGDNIEIEGGVISAIVPEYQAGAGIEIVDNTIEAEKQIPSKTVSAIPTQQTKSLRREEFIVENDNVFLYPGWIWTDGENTYYDSRPESTNYETYHYILNDGLWEPNKWNIDIWGNDVWTDGENIYYSLEHDHYQLDKNTMTWVAKTWNGLTYFRGDNIWTDGENIYYSYNSDQYVLNKETSTWNTKTWSGVSHPDAMDIWTDGDNTYYSYNNRTYILDKINSTWTQVTWNKVTSGYDVWFTGETVYYISNKKGYKFDKENSTWEQMNIASWPSPIVNGGVSRYYIWTDGQNFYWTRRGDIFDSPAGYIFNAETESWMTYSFNRVFVCQDARNFWLQDGLVHYTGNQNLATAQNTLVLNKDEKRWRRVYWSGSSHPDYGKNIWNNKNILYYSYGSTQYELGYRWVTKTWSGLSNFNGQYVWTDGDNIYYSYNAQQYILDSANSSWSTKTWIDLTTFKGNNVWTDGENIYHSDNGVHCILDKETSAWKPKRWSGFINFSGEQVWADGEDIYCFDNDKLNIYKLDKNNSEWNHILTLENPSCAWTDGDNIYLSSLYDTFEFVKTKYNQVGRLTTFNKEYVTEDKFVEIEGRVDDAVDKVNQVSASRTNIQTTRCTQSDDEFVQVQWRGPAEIEGQYIWTIGNNIYYSSGSDTQYVFNKNTKEWDNKIWSFMGFYGNYIWTDGNHTYFSSNSIQYVIDEATSTMSTKEWNGLTSFSGENVWTDGEDIYYSNGTTQYVLDASTSTWNVKTWNGLTSFGGNYIWTDGQNIYYSGWSSQYVLDASTSTWSEKTWNGLTSFGGNYIWTDGEDIYYSEGSNQYVLDKSTSTWSEKVWSGLNNFYGYNTWTDGEDIYVKPYYKLNKLTSTWEPCEMLCGAIKFYGSDIWTDGNHIYANNDSDGLNVVLDEENLVWRLKVWNINIMGRYTWTDGEDVFYSSSSSSQYKLNRLTGEWEPVSWDGMIPSYGDYIWTDGNYTYYSNGERITYKLNKDLLQWTPMPEDPNGVTFYGSSIWTDGDNIYCGGYYVLDKNNFVWKEKSWAGSTPDASGIWTDGENIYYGGYRVLDKLTSTFVPKNWGGDTSIGGSQVWYFNGDVYYSSWGYHIKLKRGKKQSVKTLLPPVAKQDYVVANPTLDGTETPLTGLQVGDTKYAIPTNANHLYSVYLKCGDNGPRVSCLSRVPINNLLNITSETVITDEIWNNLWSLKDNIFNVSAVVLDTATVCYSKISLVDDGRRKSIQFAVDIAWPDTDGFIRYGDGQEYDSIRINIMNRDNVYSLTVSGDYVKDIICEQIF